MAPSKKKAGAAKGQVTLFSFFSKANKKPAAAAAAAAPQAKQPQAAPPPAAAAAAANADTLAQIQMGSRIEVYWPDDEEWYSAVVQKQRGTSTTYSIEYETDHQCEWIDLALEEVRLLKPKDAKSAKKKRRIQQSDDEDEAEFEMPATSDEEDSSEYEDGVKDEEEEDDFLVSDSDDEEVAHGKAKKKQKTSATKSVTTSSAASSNKKRSSSSSSNATRRVSMSQFAAGSVTVTEHVGGKTPVSRRPSSVSSAASLSATKQLITPGTSSLKKQISSVSSSSRAATPTSSSANGNNNSKPPPFVEGALNPGGSHVHNHLNFLRNPVDSMGRAPAHPDYDPRTLRVVESDWKKITKKPMTAAIKQWWDLKAQYFDTVLLFKTGKFYELHHMDADIGVQACALSYMKGHAAHAGFPEVVYGVMADKLVRAGYKVARVEQTETPAQLKLRKNAKAKGAPAPKVVNREVCSVLTLGTRTFCYLDEQNGLLDDAQSPDATVGPLLAIREVLLETESVASQDSDDADADSDDDNAEDKVVKPVCEYGITLVDAVRGSVTIGQFADDVLRSRLETLLASFSPSEILLEGGENGASPALQSMIRGLQTTGQQSFRVEIIRPTENFPKSTALDENVRKQLERGTGGRHRLVHPWDVQETLDELHRRKYYPRASKQLDAQFSVKRWPKVLRAAVEGKAALALSSFGAALFYLQRNLISEEILSLGIVKAYIPPESAATAVQQSQEGLQQLAIEQSLHESGLNDDSSPDVEAQGGNNGANDPAPMDVDVPPTHHPENEITCMSLDGTTLHNLEILTNAVDQKIAGSLWSKINYTKSPHGSRLLRAWLLRPLFRKSDIDRRLDAVQELASGGAAVALAEARKVLPKCGDIERLLSRVHSMSGLCLPGEDDDPDRIHPNDRAVLYEGVTYTKRKVGDFSRVLNGLRSASQIPEIFSGVQIESPLVQKIVKFVDEGGCFPDMAEELQWFFDNFDCEQAAKGLFEPSSGIDEIYDSACDAIKRIKAQLDAYKDDMCAGVMSKAKKTWKYANTCVESKDKYLIELPASLSVPEDFIWHSKRGAGHKQVNKYRTAVVERLVKELEIAYDTQKERKEMGIKVIFARFDSKRALWAATAQATALLDALGALAQTAAKSGYTRPRILDCPLGESPRIKIVQGRHPCVEHSFQSSEFIPNDLELGCPTTNGAAPRVMLLSGPNMGGKSTLLRQTCLISILAQLGSFVPAEECELTPIDRIFTRLGASDRILLNQSTFFVELAETAAALRGATRRSLVIMDELGRGTSTFDGTAIASASVKHLIERNKCLSLFATHYHSLLDEWKDHNDVLLGHMECLVENSNEESNEGEPNDSNITFLYTLGQGVCPKSFGINVARMAALPDQVLTKAKRISTEFEQEMSAAEASRAAEAEANDVGQVQVFEKALASDDWEIVENVMAN